MAQNIEEQVEDGYKNPIVVKRKLQKSCIKKLSIIAPRYR